MIFHACNRSGEHWTETVGQRVGFDVGDPAERRPSPVRIEHLHRRCVHFDWERAVGDRVRNSAAIVINRQHGFCKKAATACERAAALVTVDGTLGNA